MVESIPVSVAVGRTIARLGAKQIFGVVGSGNFHVTNAMIDEGVPFVAARHEMGAACMADSYSRTRQELAVVSVHQGCGLTNALTGIGEAAKCHTPLVVISGDTADGDVRSNFFIDQDAAVEAVGAVPERIRSAATSIEDTTRAVMTAKHERKTVVLSLPIDFQEEHIEWAEAEFTDVEAIERVPLSPSPSDIEEVLALVAQSRRPVLVAGRGAAGAGAQLRQLGNAIGALLVTSGGGRGIFTGDEWALDIMGGFSTDGAARLIAEADLVIAVGASLNHWTTRSGALLADKIVVHVDDRQDALGFHVPVDVGIVADAARFAEAMTEALDSSESRGDRYRTTDVATQVRASRYWKDQAFEPREEPGRIDPQLMTNTLDHLLPMERVVVPDGGNFTCYPSAHLRVPDREGYCLPLSFQSIGLGLSSGIGAALASPDRVPVAAIGDGGFLMSLVELETAVRLRLGILIVVYNDAAYGAEVHVFDEPGTNLSTVTFPESDLASIARGFGCEAATVREVEDLSVVEDWLARGRPRPLVIDAKVARYPSWVLAHAHQVEVEAAGVAR